MQCSDGCKCGSQKKPCKNRVSVKQENPFYDILKRGHRFEYAILLQPHGENSERNRDDRQKSKQSGQVTRGKGFCLSRSPAESEDTIRDKEHQDVKVDFVNLSRDFCPRL